MNWPEKHEDVYYGLISTKIENFTNILLGNIPPFTAGYKGYGRHQFDHHVFANIDVLTNAILACLITCTVVLELSDTHAVVLDGEPTASPES